MRQRLMLRGVVMLVVLGLGGLVLPYWAAAHGGHDNDGKIKGVAAGLPAGGITVPLSVGSSPVEFQVTFGSPSIAFPVILTSATQVKLEEGALSATLSNGDAVEVEGSTNAEGKLLLDELELEDFFEVEIDAIITSIPGGTLALPLTRGPHRSSSSSPWSSPVRPSPWSSLRIPRSRGAPPCFSMKGTGWSSRHSYEMVSFRCIRSSWRMRTRTIKRS